MAKLTLTDIAAGYLSIATYNANNTLLEAALENTLSRDGTSPNTMSVDMDLNSNKITNVTDGTNDQDAATVAQLNAAVLAGGAVSTLGTLTDVTIASIASGELLKWNGSAWINNTIAEAGLAAASHTHVEADITDLRSYLVEAAAGHTLQDVELAHTLPFLKFNETDGGVDEDRWKMYASGGAFFFVASNDADDTDDGIFRVDRTGNSVDNILMFTEINMADEILNRAVLKDYGISQTDYVPTGTTGVLVYADGPVFTVDLESASGNLTMSITGGPIAGTYGQVTVRVQQDGASALTVTWGGGDTYRHANGVAHPMNTTLDGMTIYTAETFDAGTSWEVSGVDYS